MLDVLEEVVEEDVGAAELDEDEDAVAPESAAAELDEDEVAEAECLAALAARPEGCPLRCRGRFLPAGICGAPPVWQLNPSSFFCFLT